jgi:hypothetical protein
MRETLLTTALTSKRTRSFAQISRGRDAHFRLILGRADEVIE